MKKGDVYLINRDCGFLKIHVWNEITLNKLLVVGQRVGEITGI